MKVITINIDKESVLQEIQMLDGIQVKVPDTMSNEDVEKMLINNVPELHKYCLLYTSPSPRDGLLSRMPSSA